MTELEEIQGDLWRVKRRLEREINYQRGRSRGGSACHCAAHNDIDPDLHRLQQNLAEIRQVLGCRESTQAATMTRLRQIYNCYVNAQNSIGNALAPIRNALGLGSFSSSADIEREVRALLKRSGNRADQLRDIQVVINRKY